MKRTYLLFGLIVLLLVALTGCGGGSGGKSDSGEIKIGVVTSLTGSEAKFGEAQKRGYDMALEEINAKGGIDGKKVTMIVEDDASKPEAAMSGIEKLVTQDKVPLLIGSYSSATTLPASKKATENQVPMIIPTASADNITEQGSKYIFRICSKSSQYASNALDFLKDVAKVKKVGIIYENSNFGTSTANPAESYAKQQGMEVSFKESFQKGSPDFKPLLTKAKSTDADAVFVVSYLLDATLIMRQSRELDFNPQAYMGAGAGFSSSEFVRSDGAGTAAEYTLASTLWTPDVKWAGAKEFDDKFFKKYNVHPEYHAVEGYVALYTAADALKRAGSTDKQKVRDALAATDIKDTPFGPIKFDSNGQNNHAMLITQVKKGDFVTVWPKEVAVSEPILPTPPWKDRK